MPKDNSQERESTRNILKNFLNNPSERERGGRGGNAEDNRYENLK